jgi:hypothetical protein
MIIMLKQLRLKLDVQYLLANPQDRRWHPSHHIPFLKTSEGQLLLEHQGQLLSHPAEGPRKTMSNLTNIKLF